MAAPEQLRSGKARSRHSKRQLRARVSDPIAGGGATPRRKPLQKKLRAGDNDVTAEAILAGHVENAKSQIYHAKQRPPSLKKILTTFDFDNEDQLINSLEVARVLSPAVVSGLSKEAAHTTETEKKGN